MPTTKSYTPSTPSRPPERRTLPAPVPPAPSPSPIPPPAPDPFPAPAPVSIDLPAALRSVLRAWFASRDLAVWSLLSGADPADRLERMNGVDLQSAVEQTNALRLSALRFAEQLADSTHTVQSVLSAEIDDLLATERPKFLLSVEHLPGSF